MKWPRILRRNWYDRLKRPTPEQAYIRVWELIFEGKLPSEPMKMVMEDRKNG